MPESCSDHRTSVSSTLLKDKQPHTALGGNPRETQAERANSTQKDAALLNGSPMQRMSFFSASLNENSGTLTIKQVEHP